MALSASAPRSPSRALLHPLFLGPLAVLALNDHVLKGASLLPGSVTGKTSDFAGMLVAPLLLAAIVGVRSERGWRWAHIAVGSVFAAIQLSFAFAGAWSSLMGAVGFPWVITSDVTDLVALPMLLVSWHWLGRAQLRSVAGNARRAGELGAATAGLFACVATSYPDEPQPPIEPQNDTDGEDWGQEEDDDSFEEPDTADGGWLPDFTADAYLHNATDVDQVVRIRGLKPSVEIDCEVIDDDPGTLLTSPLFDLAETWTLPAGTNQPVGGYTETRNCRAALVEVDGLPPRLLYWTLGAPAPHVVSGTGSNPSDEGELAIIPQPEGGLGWSGAASISYDLTTAEGACEPQLDGERLAWSEPAPWGEWTVTAVEPGYDGCFELELFSEMWGDESWFVCVPEATMVIEAGDDVVIEAPTIGNGFSITVPDHEGGDRALIAVAWEQVPQLFGFELAIVPDFDCSAEVQPECGAVASPVHVSVASDAFGSAQLLPGDEPTTLRDETDQEYRFALVHGQERNAVDPGCGLGPDTIGYDIEVVVGITPKPAE